MTGISSTLFGHNPCWISFNSKYCDLHTQKLGLSFLCPSTHLNILFHFLSQARHIWQVYQAHYQSTILVDLFLNSNHQLLVKAQSKLLSKCMKVRSCLPCVEQQEMDSYLTHHVTHHHAISCFSLSLSKPELIIESVRTLIQPSMPTFLYSIKDLIAIMRILFCNISRDLWSFAL